MHIAKDGNFPVLVNHFDKRFGAVDGGVERLGRIEPLAVQIDTHQ